MLVPAVIVFPVFLVSVIFDRVFDVARVASNSLWSGPERVTFDLVPWNHSKFPA